MSTTRNVKDKTWFISKKRTLHLHTTRKVGGFTDYGLVKSAELPQRPSKYSCVVLLIGDGKYNNEKYRLRVSSYLHCPSSHEGLEAPASGRHQILNFALCRQISTMLPYEFHFFMRYPRPPVETVFLSVLCVCFCVRG